MTSHDRSKKSLAKKLGFTEVRCCTWGFLHVDSHVLVTLAYFETGSSLCLSKAAL
ncbi:hypothetical protein BGX38DRAFT_1162525 [Terfezia claveryi]|nr:hypothetical protein BGX38DRAFT_1162525 [Terfezia claveryi]